MNAKLLIPVVLVLALMASVTAQVLPIQNFVVEVDDVQVTPAPGQNLLDFERGQELPVEVRFSSTVSLNDVEVTAFISGYEYNDVDSISDTSHVFDMDANVTYIKRLTLKLSELVQEDAYKLRVIVSDRNSFEFIRSFDLKIDVPRHRVVVADVIMTPYDKIMAGRALLLTVRTENLGQKDEESVRVSASIPELGVSAVDYINEVESEEEEETEELYLKLPRCAKPGVYNVKVDISYDRRHRTVSKTLAIEVLEDETCKLADKPQTLVSLPSQPESATEASPATFSVTIANNGVAARAYTLQVTGDQGWASVRASPGTALVLGAGQSQTVYLFVTPTAGAVAGVRALSVAVTSGAETLAQGSLAVNVAPVPSVPQKSSLVRGLEILFVVLILTLVVVAVVIAAQRLMRGTGKSQVYY